MAKLASNLKKPDGLEEININNYQRIFGGLRLTDLTGIKVHNQVRLNKAGILSVMTFYRASVEQLKHALHSICGYHWYLRLRGWEVDDIPFPRRSFGSMYALPQPLVFLPELAPIIFKLAEKTGLRMRRAGYWAKGIQVGIIYHYGFSWQRRHTLIKPVFDSTDIFHESMKIISQSPYHYPVRNLSVTCFSLIRRQEIQPDLFGDLDRKVSLNKACDRIKNRFGETAIMPAAIMGMGKVAPDRIGFGNIRELSGYLRGF